PDPHRELQPDRLEICAQVAEYHLLNVLGVLAHQVRELRAEHRRALTYVEHAPEDIGVVDAPQGLAAAIVVVGPLLARLRLVASQHPYGAYRHLALRLAYVA